MLARGEAAIAVARQEDVQRAAGALDAGKKPPGRDREHAAREALEQAGHTADVASLRVDTARVALHAALGEHAVAWRDQLEQAWEQADADTLALVEQLRSALMARGELAGGLHWAFGIASEIRRERDSALKLGPRGGVPAVDALVQRNGDPYPMLDVLAAVEQAITATGAQVARDRREQAALEAQKYQAQQAARDADTAERDQFERAANAVGRVPGPAA